MDFTNTTIYNVFAHMVGNKLRDEGLKISTKDIVLDDETRFYLLKYFLSPFSQNEIYNFYHPSDLSLNEIYIYAKRVFSNPNIINKMSIDIAKHLYEKSTHPKINNGELFVCYFKNCLIDDRNTDAIGLFKSEVKDTFLKFNLVDNNFNINYDKGINIKRLDKGCLIFNIGENQGYEICIIDNKSKDTQYWKNDFLNIIPAKNHYHFTKNFLSFTNEFISRRLSDISKSKKINLLNLSFNYFKTRNNFNQKDFEKEVLQDNDVIESFRNFKVTYKRENKIELTDKFEISNQAVKKQSKIYKSILKLDENFHIHIYKNSELIEKGIEKDGRKYYKLYYEKEN